MEAWGRPAAFEGAGHGDPEGDLIRAYRRIAPYVRLEYVTQHFGEPAWERKQTVRKYGDTVTTSPTLYSTMSS